MKSTILLSLLFVSTLASAQQKLKDIFQGNESSEPRDMISTPNHNFFMDKMSLVYDTDGTEAGTVLLTDPVNSAFPFPQITSRNFSSAGDKLVFMAYQSGPNYAGQELWISDGTPAGTVEVNISPGTSSSNANRFIPISDSLTVFFAFVGSNQEIWVTNGTPTGTQRLFDFNPGGQATFYDYLLHEGKIYMQMTYGYPNPDSVWVSDGTTLGTVNLGEFRLGKDIETIGSEVFFTAGPSGSDYELWKTDGTAAGTVLVKDIEAGSSQFSFPKYFQKLNNKIFFAPDNGLQKEIWVTDGTEAGTAIVSDINTFGSSHPTHLKTFNNEIFFTATNFVNGRELYKTDGTLAGTTLVKDINPNSVGSVNYSFQSTSVDEIFMGPANGFLFFIANNGINGMELWRTDGSSAGTIMIDDINQSPEGSDLKNFTFFNDRIVFNAQKSDGTYDLFISDGNGIQSFFSYYGVSTLTKPYILAESNAGELFFTAFNPAYGYELFKVNSGGTVVLVKDIRIDPVEEFLEYDREAFVASSGDKTYFLKNDNEHGVELWSTDGTEPNTQRLTDFDPYPVSIPVFSSFSYLGKTIPGLSTFVPFNDRLFFQVDKELYMVENDIVSIFWSSGIYKVNNLSHVGNTMQWTSKDSIYVFDGTNIESHFIVASNGQNPFRLGIVEVNDQSLFFYPSSLYGQELYKFDPNTGNSTLVKDLTSGIGSIFMREMVASGSNTFFTDNNYLFVSDGTTSGTKKLEVSTNVPYRVHKLRPLADGRITFTADDGINGQEVWVSDGTVAGTKMIQDLNPGSPSSIYNYNATNLTLFSASNGRVWFPALGNIYATDGDSIYLEVIGVNFPDIYAHNGRAYDYCTNCGTVGREPYSASKNTAHLIQDVNPGTGDSYPTSFRGNGEKVFYFARDASGIYAPYVYQACPAEIQLLEPIETSQVYQSEYAIEGFSTNTIKTNQSVSYQSNGYVLLKPGFETESGAVFKAELGVGCVE